MCGWAGQSTVPVRLVFLTAPTRPALPQGSILPVPIRVRVRLRDDLFLIPVPHR